MQKPAVLLAVVVLAVFLMVGRRQDALEFDSKSRLKTPIGASEQVISPEEKALGQLAPPQGGIAPSQARVSHYQGIEVQIDGLQWLGRWFRPNQDHGISRVGGVQLFDLNKLIFDPDPADTGKPDLIATVGDVRFFDINEFLRESLGGYQLAKILGQKLSSPGPYETYSWNVRDKDGRIAKKVQMDLWLLDFTLLFQIQPSIDKKSSTSLPRGTRHPVTGESITGLGAEYDNQRYGNLDVALKLVPKTDDWLLAQVDEHGGLVPNQNPQIGIAAVETIAVKFEGDTEGRDLRIGAYIEKGQSLALHDRLDFGSASANPPERGQYLTDVTSQTSAYYRVKEQQGQTYLNPELFNRDKYALVHLANIGSWKRGNVFTGTRKWADQITARFVIHAFVVGDWEIKRPAITTELAPRQQPRVETRSLVARLLPSFGLGLLGRSLSGIGAVLIAVFVLALLFPPILTIVNTVLEAIARSTQRLLRPKGATP